MAPSEPPARVRLGAADVQAGVALSDGAGWNQTADDWRLFVEHGHAIGWRSADGELVASAAALPYGGEGWISMVLVAPPWRHRGLATDLLGQCVAHLRRSGIVPVLDATPAGQPVYGRLGFLSGFALARWEGEPRAGETAPAVVDGANVRPADAGDIEAIAALDAAATGLARGFLLRDFLARQGSRAWLVFDDARRAVGFTIVRQGRKALQIGPLIAQTAVQALALLEAAFAHGTGRVFLDVPERWAALGQALAQRGFKRQRSFVRMALASPLPSHISQPDGRLFVLAGPEFG
jgi:GNAT superfamily N-acetyltransferase